MKLATVLFASAILLSMGQTTSVLAQTADIDENPLVEYTTPDQEPGEIKSRSQKPLMQWKDGWLYARQRKHTNHTVYNLFHTDCKSKRTKSLYKTIVNEDGTFFSESRSYDDEYNSVENSTSSVEAYCKTPKVLMPNVENMPIAQGFKKDRLKRYHVLERKGDVVKVFAHTPIQGKRILETNSITSYNCKTKEAKGHFSFQIMANGEVIQYEAPTKPTWNPGFSKEKPEFEKYNQMVDTYCGQ
jgi:hypothetical protein